MGSNTLLNLGFGYTAQALAQRLAPKGWRIKAVSRDETKASIVAELGGEFIPWREAPLPPEIFEDVDAVLVSTPPGQEGCPAFKAAGEAIAAHSAVIKWIGYLSSNGVYGDHDGAWVDEDAPLKPSTQRGKNRIKAESEWAIQGVSYGTPVVIFRARHLRTRSLSP